MPNRERNLNYSPGHNWNSLTKWEDSLKIKGRLTKSILEERAKDKRLEEKKRTLKRPILML
ncbi:MAG: hypothetical protein ACOY3D_07140 [Candidatus Omnitrophota bacterium]